MERNKNFLLKLHDAHSLGATSKHTGNSHNYNNLNYLIDADADDNPKYTDKSFPIYRWI
jgi:hypothetical protein